MPKKSEVLQEIKPLLTAYEKHLNEGLAELWAAELREYSLEAIKRAVRFFLDSPTQKTFPKIGEFKAATGTGGEKKNPTKKEPESCSRCTHGLCSVGRMVGEYPAPVNYTFRCSCPAGNNYPGLPLVSHFERTKKEEYAAQKAEWRAA